MASSSEIRKYPPRLNKEGDVAVQNHSINHNCLLSKFGTMKEGLGDDVWEYLKTTSLGVFLKFSELPYTWAGYRVHYFITHLLKVNNSHEIWSLIGGQPIRLSLNEFKEITGLNCEPINEQDAWDVKHDEFWAELGISTLIGPSFMELVDVIDRCKTWSFQKKVMVGRLCILSIAVYGIHHGSRIPLESAKRVLDPEVFESYPWGRVAFSSLIKSVKEINYENDATTLKGCVHILLIWIYESVPCVAEAVGYRRNTEDIPFLNWRSSRHRKPMKQLIEKGMEDNGGKVCTTFF